MLVSTNRHFQGSKAKEKIRVAVSGYGVIGRRVVDAVGLQEDMELVGIADIVDDYRIRKAQQNAWFRPGITDGKPLLAAK